ncbi:MAG TPA: hypothetical protein VN922_20070 [Bacteroidia bacterium]|nr:hypothetical protein [Bacteroidia bacterium]
MAQSVDSLDLPDVQVTARAPTPTTTFPSQAPFAVRQITPIFRLGQGSFGGSGFNTVTLKGLRCTVQIEKVIQPDNPTCILNVFGMTLDQMNSVSRAGAVWQNRNDNEVAIMAGDSISGQTMIFNGWIKEAFPDGSNPPDMPLVVLGIGGTQIQFSAPTPVTFKGSVPIATALQQIIQGTGLTLENNGVNVNLSNPYFKGSTMEMIQSACIAADCFYYIDWIKKLLIIYPKNGFRSSQSNIPTVSPDTGMINYPTFELQRMKVRTLFDPALHAPSVPELGMRIQVKSQLTAANGTWTIVGISYNLSSELPNGPWEMALTCMPISAGL